MKMSLKTKAILIVILIAAEFSVVTAIVSNMFITRVIKEDYFTRALDLSKTVSVSVDADEVKRVADAALTVYRSSENRIGNEMGDLTGEEYIAKYDAYIAGYDGIDESEDYLSILSTLRKIQEVNDVECIYVACLDVESRSFIYLVDAALEEACDTGSYDPIYDVNSEVLENPERGFPPYTTNTQEYGWLVTAGTAIKTDDGTVVGYAMLDISMQEIHDAQRDFVLRLIIILTAMTLTVALITILFVNLVVVKPIRKLSSAAALYTTGDGSEGKKLFSNLGIRNNDEIGVLADSIEKMENDINDHISKLIEINKELSSTRIKAERMGELANKDALTGVRNRTSYDRNVLRLNGAIKSGNAVFGIAMIDLNYLKRINDQHGHEAGDAAIKKTCEIVCNVFARSKVFRIGGDEFAVILENSDYDRVDELVKEFHDRIRTIAENKDLQPYERISAAIGYSLFDPDNDKNADDVFRRADVEMYEDKKRVKAQFG
ncbi:MAG: diguanylate cyclase [Clostridia bacterium]|nr:diguanylate cyclase [Clostridia bacterium]